MKNNCEYIHQGEDNTSYCKLAEGASKELIEARRVIEALKAEIAHLQLLVDNIKFD